MHLKDVTWMKLWQIPRFLSTQLAPVWSRRTCPTSKMGKSWRKCVTGWNFSGTFRISVKNVHFSSEVFTPPAFSHTLISRVFFPCAKNSFSDCFVFFSQKFEDSLDERPEVEHLQKFEKLKSFPTYFLFLFFFYSHLIDWLSFGMVFAAFMFVYFFILVRALRDFCWIFFKSSFILTSKNTGRSRGHTIFLFRIRSLRAVLVALLTIRRPNSMSPLFLTPIWFFNFLQKISILFHHISIRYTYLLLFSTSGLFSD